MSFHSHNRYRLAIKFRWDLPSINEQWIALEVILRDVRARLGQSGVEEFVAEWRKRGHIECSDEAAKELTKP